VPDVIISDVMMPEKDGFEVCHTLKNDMRTSHIPIILLTAKADAKSRIEGLETGADAYLAKPFRPEELEVRLKKLIELRKKLQVKYGALTEIKVEDQKYLSLDERFIRKLRTAIEDNLSDEHFGIEQLCKAMGISRMQLHRKLKALTNSSASHYIRNIRLEKALKLLRSTDRSVSEIAYEVGFRNPSYFTESFTERYGMPPSKVR
jgi:YesN/AraC family two-component response regulator